MHGEVARLLEASGVYTGRVGLTQILRRSFEATIWQSLRYLGRYRKRSLCRIVFLSSQCFCWSETVRSAYLRARAFPSASTIPSDTSALRSSLVQEMPRPAPDAISAVLEGPRTVRYWTMPALLRSFSPDPDATSRLACRASPEPRAPPSQPLA